MASIATTKQIAKALKSQKIEAKQAIEIALGTFSEFYPQFTGANVMLEEIEESEDGKWWLITLGYDAKRALSPHHRMFQSETYRAYKTFKIDKASGKVAAMKIKSVE